MNLKTDPKRANQEGRTGILVRAERPDGSFASVDIAELDAISLVSWLISQDGRAVFVVAALLGHRGPGEVDSLGGGYTREMLLERDRVIARCEEDTKRLLADMAALRIRKGL